VDPIPGSEPIGAFSEFKRSRPLVRGEPKLGAAAGKFDPHPTPLTPLSLSIKVEVPPQMFSWLTRVGVLLFGARGPEHRRRPFGAVGSSVGRGR